MVRSSLRNAFFFCLVVLAGCVEVPPLGGGTGYGEHTRVTPEGCEALGGETIADIGDGSSYRNGCGEGRELLAHVDFGIEGGICCTTDELGEPCGPTTCGAGEVCCNESCGICTPPDGACIELYCEPSPPSCDTMACDQGSHCEMVDVVCVTDPCPPHPTCVANPTCDDVDCFDDSECHLIEVQCIKAPCFPVPQCVPAG